MVAGWRAAVAGDGTVGAAQCRQCHSSSADQHTNTDCSEPGVTNHRPSCRLNNQSEAALQTVMAASAYLSQGSQGPGPASEAGGETDGVMNLVNPAVSQGYSLPREQVVRQHRVIYTTQFILS